MSHSKLHQIVRLREMLQRWRRRALRNSQSFSDVRSAAAAAEAAASSAGMRRRVHTKRSLSLPTNPSSSSSSGRVAAGHFAVYVGEERKRFLIKMSYLSHPLFRALLKKTEEEMGFHQEGALTIPCQVSFFEHLLHLIQSHSHTHSHHHGIMAILHLSSPRHRHRSDDDNDDDDDHKSLQYEELLQELLHFTSPDPTHHHHHHHSSPLHGAPLSSLCNLAHSLSCLDVSATTNGASHAILA